MAITPEIAKRQAFDLVGKRLCRDDYWYGDGRYIFTQKMLINQEETGESPFILVDEETGEMLMGSLVPVLIPNNFVIRDFYTDEVIDYNCW